MIPEYLRRNLDLFQTGEYTVVSDKGSYIFWSLRKVSNTINGRKSKISFNMES